MHYPTPTKKSALIICLQMFFPERWAIINYYYLLAVIGGKINTKLLIQKFLMRNSFREINHGINMIIMFDRDPSQVSCDCHITTYVYVMLYCAFYFLLSCFKIKWTWQNTRKVIRWSYFFRIFTLYRCKFAAISNQLLFVFDWVSLTDLLLFV